MPLLKQAESQPKFQGKALLVSSRLSIELLAKTGM
jgi:hypothetical protein